MDEKASDEKRMGKDAKVKKIERISYGENEGRKEIRVKRIG